MAGLPGSIPSMLPAGEDETQRKMADLRRDLNELGPSVARSFKPVVDDLAAQVAFLIGQSFGYTSAKDWYVTGVSGINGWETLAYDATYDDEYTFMSSSTGILKVEVSSAVLLDSGAGALGGGTAIGYSLSWPGGSLGYAGVRAARLSGDNVKVTRIDISNTSVVTVPGNVLVTLRTARAKWSPVSPGTTWHGTRDTTVVVTRVGM